jgi:hypothetical protein
LQENDVFVPRQIEKVIGLAGQEKGIPIGALTSDNRDNWADVCIFNATFFLSVLINYTHRLAQPL